MKYKICELEALSVIGKEIMLTKSQKENMNISKQFWITFNKSLKDSSIFQSKNWVKFAFMERRDGNLFYYCAVLKKEVVKEGFILKNIEPYTYLVVEHAGGMDKIYDTHTKLYKDIVANTKYIPLPENFLHFERYDHRFHWNNKHSIIEIWLPIKRLSSI